MLEGETGLEILLKSFKSFEGIMYSFLYFNHTSENVKNLLFKNGLRAKIGD